VKYLVLLGDGMAGLPMIELGGKTVLQYAKTPNLDYLASHGTMGLARTVPEGMPPGSDVANLSVLGYDPRKYYTGRAPLEAAAMGLPLGPKDVAYRCNLVTLAGLEKGYESSVMEDFSAGHISTDDARALVHELEQRLGGSGVSFHPGVSYRHLMLWKGGEDGAVCTPPHDITGKPVAGHLPSGPGADFLLGMMKASVEAISGHEVNRRRAAAGKSKANSIWLWGQGKKPALPSFKERYNISGAMISAVDLLKGIAATLGMKVIEVPGATGYIDTDYKGKAQAALSGLDSADFVYVHVEAPDEAGHSGNLHHKIQAVEDFDEKVVGTVLNAVKGKPGFRVLSMPDHPTPIKIKSHTGDPVPFVLWDSGKDEQINNSKYDEAAAAGTGLLIEEGWKLIDRLLEP
jgi:2,3-bisphosphoglycerate-independent phosphoglycerate mutase